MFRQTRLAQIAILAIIVGGGCTENAPSTPAGNPTATPGSLPANDQAVLTDVDPTTAATLSEQPLRPRFHGPRGDNVSTDTGLLTQWPEAGPELVWTAEGIGQGFSSVTLSGGLIFTAGNIDDKTVVTALDLDGNVRWQAENGEAWTADPGGSRGTPIVDGNRVYHESPSGSLICVDARNGRKIWRMNIIGSFEGENIRWALAESVLIDGDRVICSPGAKRATVASLNKMTGQPLWTTPNSGDKAGYFDITPEPCDCIGGDFLHSCRDFVGLMAQFGKSLGVGSNNFADPPIVRTHKTTQSKFRRP